MGSAEEPANGTLLRMPCVGSDRAVSDASQSGPVGITQMILTYIFTIVSGCRTFLSSPRE